jgi:hypothetical protein
MSTILNYNTLYFLVYILDNLLKDLNKAKDGKPQEEAKVSSNVSQQVTSCVKEMVSVDFDIWQKL